MKDDQDGMRAGGLAVLGQAAYLDFFEFVDHAANVRTPLSELGYVTRCRLTLWRGECLLEKIPFVPVQFGNQVKWLSTLDRRHMPAKSVTAKAGKFLDQRNMHLPVMLLEFLDIRRLVVQDKKPHHISAP